ncbi:MAG: two-component system sensor histidine kinase CreC [Psychrobacter sp.]|nr:two-component system sensor histidine kinase CreC [Psychrobacter sp.]
MSRLMPDNASNAVSGKDTKKLADNKPNNNTQQSQNSWYAKLHPIGSDQQTTAPKRVLNLSIFFRIWLAVALVLIICGIVVFTQLFGHVKPTAQQVIEDTLLDTSKLLAASLQMPLQTGEMLTESYQKQLDSAFVYVPVASEPDDNIELANSSRLANSADKYRQVYKEEPAYRRKTYSSFRVYVTDSTGLVIYDSRPTSTNAEGQDYSRWNDVYLTLLGQYGARSTPDIDSKRDSSIMYVAQPIKDAAGQLIGVVSVGKPVDSVMPYLDNTRRRMLITMLLISIVALLLAGLVAWWLKQSISLVTHYTRELAEQTKKPYFYLGHELNSLTDTIESMKHRLENRAYVSDYVHTLTHELKSPLTAIRASSELLEDDGLDPDDRLMLNHSIGEQSIKMQQLIDRLLLLAKVEQPTFKLNRESIALLPLLNSLIKDSMPKLQQRQLPAIELFINDNLLNNADVIQSDFIEKTTVFADSFWLLQALQNVLDNAIYFAENKVVFNIYTNVEQAVTLTVFNDGKPLPDYALAKVFDRYFSLSHQRVIHINSTSQNSNEFIQPSQSYASANNQNSTMQTTPKKGTGLGLTLVKQVIEHHGGTVAIDNVQGNANANSSAGVIFSITLPLAKPSKNRVN